MCPNTLHATNTSGFILSVGMQDTWIFQHMDSSLAQSKIHKTFMDNLDKSVWIAIFFIFFKNNSLITLKENVNVPLGIENIHPAID